MILVGEVRDVETARIAVQSALTGHRVFSSVHAIDAVVGALPAARHGHRAVPRHVGDRRRGRAATRAPHLHVVRDAVRAVARRAHALPRSSAARDKRRVGAAAPAASSAPSTGYFERVGVYEVLADHRRAPPVRRRRPTAARRTRARRSQQGLRTLQPEAMRLVEHDVTTMDEVVKHVFVGEELE